METKRYPNGTTEEQWRVYEEDLRIHELLMESTKPRPELYADPREYDKAMTLWHMDLHCGAPNKPGYYRANND